MRIDLPQRIPYPTGSEGQTGVYGALTNGQRLSYLVKPAVRAGIQALSSALLREGVLAPSLREMIIVRVGYQTGSHYEVEQHTSLGESLGVPRAKLEALAHVNPPGLSDAERSVIAFVDALLTEPDPGDDAVQGVRAHFSDGELMEMVFVTGNWWMLSRMLATARVPSDSRKIGEQGVAPLPTVKDSKEKS